MANWNQVLWKIGTSILSLQSLPIRITNGSDENWEQKVFSAKTNAVRRFQEKNPHSNRVFLLKMPTQYIFAFQIRTHTHRIKSIREYTPCISKKIIMNLISMNTRMHVPCVMIGKSPYDSKYFLKEPFFPISPNTAWVTKNTTTPLLPRHPWLLKMIFFTYNTSHAELFCTNL